MSREVWGDPPERQEVPECCPACGSDFYMPGCPHCKEVRRRNEADAEVTRLRGLIRSTARELALGGLYDGVRSALLEALESGPGQSMAAGNQWPREKAAGRIEDMGPGHLWIVLDSDNDVCVSVWDGQRSVSVEFCNPGGGGGGRSSRTRMALIALMVAIEADNAERPDLAFPPRADKEGGAA